MTESCAAPITRPDPLVVSHWFHLIMTFLTGGLWAVIWIAIWASARAANTATDRWFDALSPTPSSLDTVAE